MERNDIYWGVIGALKDINSTSGLTLQILQRNDFSNADLYNEIDGVVDDLSVYMGDLKSLKKELERDDTE